MTSKSLTVTILTQIVLAAVGVLCVWLCLDALTDTFRLCNVLIVCGLAPLAFASFSGSVSVVFDYCENSQENSVNWD